MKEQVNHKYHCYQNTHCCMHKGKYMMGQKEKKLSVESQGKRKIDYKNQETDLSSNMHSI